MLHETGYFTVIPGKWHLALKREIAPCSRGFKKNFSYLAGCGKDFIYEPQLEYAGDDSFTLMRLSKWKSSPRWSTELTQKPNALSTTCRQLEN
ncbi:hypothetical protein BDV23DRAFT_186618 [Aspergillus alliaceus]|uniref:Sulfatase N-terminal domain-containing protein n=1 Tax=Petromyces alliaceus TaxID=209559 RepID=A0A5N7BZ79_PETAA|nr:hypothetical protein BDV23DRAFT_186618 [Aspergillus alliaceus]